MKTKTLKFNGNEIVFIRDGGNQWMIPAKLIGKAMGYTNGGQKLADVITSSWKKGWEQYEDFQIFTGTELQELKELTPQYGVSLNAKSVLFLTISGVIKVLMRSEAALAKDFRTFLAKNGGDLFDGVKQTGKAFFKGRASHQKVSSQLLLQFQTEDLEEFRASLEFFKKQGIYNAKELKVFANKLLEVQLTKISKSQGVNQFLSDGTVPNAPIVGLNRATISIPEGNFKVITKERPFHPAYEGWLPASEIGRPYGLKADFVKKYLKKFVTDRGADLPNNDAKKLVEANGGRFPTIDKDGYIIHLSQKVDGIALFTKMDGNSLNWKNFWAPSVVKEIRALISKEKTEIQNGAESDLPVHLDPTSPVVTQQSQAV